MLIIKIEILQIQFVLFKMCKKDLKFGKNLKKDWKK